MRKSKMDVILYLAFYYSLKNYFFRSDPGNYKHPIARSQFVFFSLKNDGGNASVMGIKGFPV